MPPTQKTTAAILVTCSDWRLREEATKIDAQLKEKLRVERIIPLDKPGVIRLYADPKAVNSPTNLDGLLNANTTVDDVLRFGLEIDIKCHIELHDPESVLVAGHHDCLGHLGDDDHQRKVAVMAANALRHRLGRFCFRGQVFPGMFRYSPNPGWALELL